MTNVLSRQRRWQLRQKENGLCELCNNSVYFYRTASGKVKVSVLCLEHRRKQLEKRNVKHPYPDKEIWE